jgi:hypothetical protein
MREPSKLSLRLQVTSKRQNSLSRFTIQLSEDIKKHLDSTVEITSGSSGASFEKSPAGIDWNMLLITLAASGGALTTLINLIKDRITHDKTITIEINGNKLSLSGADIDSDNLNKLIGEFVRANADVKKRVGPKQVRHAKSSQNSR